MIGFQLPTATPLATARHRAVTPRERYASLDASCRAVAAAGEPLYDKILDIEKNVDEIGTTTPRASTPQRPRGRMN